MKRLKLCTVVFMVFVLVFSSTIPVIFADNTNSLSENLNARNVAEISEDIDESLSISDDANTINSENRNSNTDLRDMQIGNDWTLGDFLYDANKVIGFSQSGLEKVTSQKDLVLPHINPDTGQNIDIVGENEDKSTNFTNRRLTSVRDYNGNIKIIEGHGSNLVRGDRSSGIFLNNVISEINLPNIEKIGSYAFKDNKIDRLNFPKLQTIGSHSFMNNKITEIKRSDLPSVKILEDLTFAGNSGLSKISMPALESTGNSTFYKIGLETVDFPKLETAGPNTFRTNKLTEVTPANFPSLKYIESTAFYENKIKKIDLPTVIRLEDAFVKDAKDIDETRIVTDNFQKLEIVGDYALFGLNIKELNIPNLKTVGTSSFDKNPGVGADVYDGKFEGKVLIWSTNEGTVSKENYLINPSLDIVAEGDWNEQDFIWDRDDDTKVLGFSPQGLYKYEAKVKNNPNPNASLVLPEKTVTIGSNSFRGLGLTSVSGNNVEVIEERAFYENKLTDINASFPKLRKIIGVETFASNMITSIDLPLLENVPDNTFNKNKITSVKLDSVRSIGDFAFGNRSFGYTSSVYEGGSVVESLYAPLVTTIGKGAFMNHNLKELNLPSVETIGKFAFSFPNTTSAYSFRNDYDGIYDSRITGYEEKSLKVVNIPKAVVIEDLAFAGNNIETLNAESLEKVLRRAFDKNSIKNINLPNIKIIGTKAFKDNKISNVTGNSAVEEIQNDAFLGNRSKNDSKRETFIILENHQNINDIQDGIVNSTRHHVINPTKVTVEYVDDNGNKIFEGITEYILSDKIYDAINDFRYVVDEQTKVATDDRSVKNIRFIYSPRVPVENTSGIEIRQSNENNINTGSEIQRYHIGETMTTNLYLDLTGIETSYSQGKIKVYYDYRYIEDGSIEVLREGAPSITGFVARNGVIEIDLDKIQGGFSLETKIKYKFKKNITPDNYRMEINTVFENNGDILSIASPIYLEGYYNKPKMVKSSPLNLPDYDYSTMSSESNGPRYMGVLGKYVTRDNRYEYKIVEAAPVRYNFYTDKLEREIEKVVVTDILPTYTAVNDDGTEEVRTAVFDEALNPNWVLSDDKRTVTFSKSFNPTIYVGGQISPLYLKFPNLKSGFNVKNVASMQLTPNNIGSREEVIDAGSDEISIYTGHYDNTSNEGDPRFFKEVKSPRYGKGSYRAFFYDIQNDREKIIPYIVRASSMASLSDLVDVRITDYDLDSRLYYYGITVPRDDHTAGGITVRIKAYSKIGENMDPSKDTILYDEDFVLSKQNNIVFDDEIAKNIDYIQIVLPNNHKLMSAIELQIDTKLREPDKSHYISAGNSGDNIYKNYAVMSGNLYQKDTDNPISVRTNSILDGKGVEVSKYTEKWDNIEGNYFWGERAEVQVRDYNAQIGLAKTQSYPTTRSVKPGEEGTYSLSLIPRIYSSNGEPEYNVSLEYDLNNFEMIDLMPRGVEPTDILLSDGFKSSGGTYKLEENYKNSGRLAIIFKTPKLKKGVYHIANIKSVIDISAPEGFATNEAFVTFDMEKNIDGVDKVIKYGVKEAPIGNSDGREWLKSQKSVRIIKAKEMVARKYIRNEGDLKWSIDGIKTESEGKFQYKLSLINNMVTPRTNVSVVDFFPYVGDESIQEENIGNQVRPKRGSEFENKLDLSKAIILKDGRGVDVTNKYTISYWNSDNKINYNGRSADDVIASLSWSESPAENTRAIKIDAKEGTIISHNDKLDIFISMVAPKNDISNNFELTGKKAWNSYVRKDNETIRYIEPNKVYNMLPEPLGTLEFKKFGKVGISSTDSFVLQGAKFELVKISENEEGEPVEEIVSNATSDKEGLVKFENINILNDYKVREVESEEVRRENIVDKYKLSEKILEVKYDDYKKHYEKNGNYDIKISDEKSKDIFTNIKPIYGNVLIEKVSASGRPLQYIRFALRKIGTDKEEYVREGLTDSLGKLSFYDVMEGKYELVELKVNAGIKVDSGTSYVPMEPKKIIIDKEHRIYDFTGNNRIVNNKVQLLINKVGVKSVEDIPDNDTISSFTDNQKVKLSGFKFNIIEVDNPNNKIMSEETNREGFVIVKNLKPDTLYEISEVEKDDDKYYTNKKVYRFKINEKTQLLDENNKVFTQSAINFANAEKVKVIGKKIWKDSENQDGIRPSQIEVNLLANGEKIATKTVAEADDWSFVFDNLPKYSKGEEIIYTVSEIAVEGYESEVTGDAKSGYIITNTHKPEYIEISGSKTWNDMENKYGKRPEYITVRLLANGKEVDVKVISKDDWRWHFTNLKRYEAGKEIVYTVTEDAVAEYSTTIKGYSIENTYTPNKTSITVTKSWQDNNDQDGIRPNKITVKLLADGVLTDKVLELRKEDNWTGVFDNLDEYQNGKKIIYTVEEVKVEGYNNIITGDEKSGYIITNIHKPDKPKRVKTNDNTSTTLWIFTCILSLIGITYFYKLKKKNYNR